MRGPEPGDAAHVVAFVNDEARRVPGAATIDVDWLERTWSAPGVQPATDVAIVVNQGDEVCAWVSLTCRPPHDRVQFEGVVRRADQGRGLGSALLEEVTRRAERFRALADPPGQAIQGLTLVGVAEIDALMTAHGFRPARYFLQLEAELKDRPAPPAPVTGVDLRGYVAGDLASAHGCIAAAFEDTWGDPFPGLEEWQRGIDDTSLWSVATAAGAVVGVVTVVLDPPDHGYVAELGVLAAWRGRGVGEALLRTALGSIHAAGLGGARLHVDADSLTGATRLYERVGMTGRPSFMWWERA
jgi:ribosomal protein S18 acetylase RimI-like enzyme